MTQAAVVVAALAASGVAFHTANRSVDVADRSIEVAREGIQRQFVEDRLSIALSSVGADRPAERIGGFALLRRHVGAQVFAASSDDASKEERLDAYRLYTVGLDVLEGYLRSPVEPPSGSDDPPSGRGYGRPRVPYDNVYAGSELRALVNMEADVDALRLTPEEARTGGPGVDLARAQLYGQQWSGIDFSWLSGRYFAGIDLRAANLRGSVWGEFREGKPSGAALNGAFLQCADLTGADLIGVNLEGADLRGAILNGTDFTGASLTGAKIDGAVGDENTTGLADLEPLPSTSPVDPGSCIDTYQAPQR